MQPTTDFCDYHNIEWFPIHVSIIEGKKELCNTMHALYKSIKCDNCNEYKNDCKCKEPKFYQTHKPNIHNFNDRLHLFTLKDADSLSRRLKCKKV